MTNTRNTAVSMVALLLTTAAGASIAWAQQETPPAASTAEIPAPIIRRVVVIGTRGVKSEEVVAAVMAVANGKPGDGETLRAVAGAVSGFYQKRGFSVAQVVDSVVDPDGTLTLTIAEGTIRRVIIRGNSRTASSVIRSTVALKPGDPYREDEVRDARNRLARLGIFEEVIVVGALDGASEADTKDDKADQDKEKQDKDKKDSKTDSTDKTDTNPLLSPDNAAKETTDEPTPDTPVSDEVGYVDLIVRVKERRTGNIAATVGYNDGTGLIGFFDFSEDNVAGTAHRASIQWQRTNTSRFTSNGEFIEGRTRSAYQVTYDVPSMGPRSLALGAEVYNTNTVFLPFFSNNQENLRNYEIRKGGKVRVGRAWGKNTVFLTARHDQVGYDPIPDSLNPPIQELLNSDATIAALGLNLIMDGRDDVNNPRIGYLNNLSYEKAGRFLGGNRSLGRFQSDIRSYAPLGFQPQSPILALRLIAGATNKNAPLSEQFWLGGYDLLRGYDLFSIRGNKMVMTSAELRFPIGPGFQAVAFTDIGNAFLPDERFTVSNLKGSGGLGLRFLTPIGPLRVDLAYGSRLQTYVSLGQSY